MPENLKELGLNVLRGDKRMEKSPYSEFDLTGKAAVVTGARRGIGYHIALALGKYGADVIVCSRTVSNLKKVGAEIEELGDMCWENFLWEGLGFLRM